MGTVPYPGSIVLGYKGGEGGKIKQGNEVNNSDARTI